MDAPSAGMQYTKIAKIMGLSPSVVSQHVRNAERRFRDHEWYLAHERWKNSPTDLTLSRGECEMIVDALMEYEQKVIKDAHRTFRNEWRNRLPYEAQLIPPLLEKVQMAVYGEIRRHSFLLTLGMQEDAKKAASRQ